MPNLYSTLWGMDPETEASITEEFLQNRNQRELPMSLYWELDVIPWSVWASRVYMHFIRRAGKDGKIYPSYASIGEQCFRATMPNAKSESLRRRAIEAVKELINLGLICRLHRSAASGNNQSNIYLLCRTSEWLESAKVATPPQRGPSGKRQGKTRKSRQGGDPGSPPGVVGTPPGDGGALKDIQIEENQRKGIQPLTAPAGGGDTEWLAALGGRLADAHRPQEATAIHQAPPTKASEQQDARNVFPVAPEIAPRPRKEVMPAAVLNPMKAAVAEGCWPGETPGDWGYITNAAKSLISQGFTPEEVRTMCAELHENSGWSGKVTPGAIAKYALTWRTSKKKLAPTPKVKGLHANYEANLQAACEAFSDLPKRDW